MKLEPTGTVPNFSHKNNELIARIRDRVTTKNEMFLKRKSMIDMQKSIMAQSVPTMDTTNTGEPRKLFLFQDARNLYKSALPQQAWNFLQDVKLFPDFIEFTPLELDFANELLTKSQNLGVLHKQIRHHGRYKEAVDKAKSDLIFGECFLRRRIQVDVKGRPVKITYDHIPWENVRPMYDEHDLCVINEFTIQQYLNIFGKEMIGKVTYGGIIEGEQDIIDYEALSFGDRNKKTIQVVEYWNKATGEYAEVHGTGYVNTYLEGEDYPWRNSDDEPYCPVQQRNFFKPFNSKLHGWGVMDILIPLANLETTIVNATAYRAIETSDPLTIISSNDPARAEKQWNIRQADKRVGASPRPMFVSDQNMGLKMGIDQIDQGVNNNNFQLWQNFLNDQAIKRSRIDFNSLTDFARTLGQQQLRQQVQDRVNQAVMRDNQRSDQDFALQDIDTLKRTECKFKNKELRFIDGDQTDESLRDDMGRFPVVERKIRDFLKDLGDFDVEIEPRVDGIFDDQTASEVEGLKNNAQLMQPGTVAHEKYMTRMIQKTDPKSGIVMGDFSKPVAPEQPPELEGPPLGEDIPKSPGLAQSTDINLPPQ